jgi:SAM-dependent methyltransferase
VAGARPTGWKSYDSVADDYDRLTPPLFGAIARDLVELLAPRAGVTVLDAGTGTGVTAEAVAKVIGADGFVVGVDPSLAMLHLARRRTAPLVGGAAPGLPFPDETFDIVLANLVLSRFRDSRLGRLWGGRGRYLRSITDDETWDAFRSAALADLERRFPEGVRSAWRARLAVGTKPT